CIMYECLTGKPPFGGASPVACFYEHLHSAPKAFADLEKDLQVPAFLEQIVMRCLEKQPEDRFASVKELQSALQALSTGTHTKSPKQFTASKKRPQTQPGKATRT